jgi:phosphate acetyltransferase
MEIIENIIKTVKENKRTIVLPESSDLRILKATQEIEKQGIANIILIGNENIINKKAKEENIDISGVVIQDPLLSDKRDECIKAFYELRKEKGITIEDARKLMQNEVYFGTMLVKLGYADGLVSGAIHPTADTLRPALQIIKGKEKGGLVSSFFLMELPNSKYEKNYIFSDCGLIPNPTSDELAKIAIEANNTYKLLIGRTPQIALLSYSTYGSAKSESVDKVKLAKAIALETNKDILIDGELQLDAAIDETVAKLKAPESKIAGHANVLIFPNLDAGNIGYKLVERFGGATAYGPITQGLAKPVNDLSRGCKYEDIIGVVAITCLQV